MGTQKPSGGNKGGDVRAGGGYFEFFAKDNLTRVLDKIQAKVKSFGSMMSRLGGSMMKGGAALGAGPLGLLFGGGSRLAETAQLARQFEIPIQMMGKFQHAAKRAGVSVEEVMNDTRGRFSDLLKDAPLIDPSQAEAALQIQHDFKDAVESLQEAMTPLLGLIAPLAKDVSRFVQANAGGVRIIAAASVGMLGFGAVLKVTGISLAGIAGLAPLAFGAMVSPIGIASLAVGGLTVAFFKLTDTGKAMFGDFQAGVVRIGQGFSEFADTAQTAWGGMVAAIGNGDLEGAFGIAAIALKLEWKKIMLFWREAWVEFRDGWLGDFRRGCDIIQNSGVMKVAKDTWGNFKGYVEAGMAHEVRGMGMIMDAVGIKRGDARNPAAAAAVAAGPPPEKHVSTIGLALGPALGAELSQALGPAIAQAWNHELKQDPDTRRLKAEIAELNKGLKDAVVNAKAPEAGGGIFGDLLDQLRGGAGAVGMADEEQKRFKEHGMRGMQRAFDEVKGGFNSSSALGQFGFGSKAAQETEINKAIRENTKKTAEEVALLVSALMLR